MSMPESPVPGRKQALALVAWLGITFLAAAAGAIASVSAPGFYASLERPAWAPPGAVFGPIWNALYFLMAVSAWLVWREQAAPGRRLALGLFVGQLVLNALWSWLFFAWRLGSIAFAEVVLLLGFIAATLAAFRRVRALAAVLLVPYLAWVAFAAALTWAVWQRNPAALG